MSCSACKVVEDTSQSATDAGDYTLVSAITGGEDAQSNCLGIPNGGYDVCRFIEGAPISSSWTIVVPNGGAIQGNQIILFYKDIQKVYSASGNSISIPFSDMVGTGNWSKSMDGEIESLAMIQYKDSSGVIQTSRAMGIARLLVLPSTYSVMPLNSGLQAWSAKVTCLLQYSTAGRSAYQCH